jgi:hypothetical protein
MHNLEQKELPRNTLNKDMENQVFTRQRLKKVMNSIMCAPIMGRNSTDGKPLMVKYLT